MTRRNRAVPLRANDTHTFINLLDEAGFAGTAQVAWPGQLSSATSFSATAIEM